VTLAVGMAHIFDQALAKVSVSGEAALKGLWKYWYHFAIMFEALFILTTIDAGTRIARFLLQEFFGKAHPKLGQTDWLPGALFSTLIVVAGWGFLIEYNSFDMIWRMFGIANQMLAVIALAIVSAYLVSEGRGKYVWVTLTPMAVVLTTTSSAAILMFSAQWNTINAQLANATRTSNEVLIQSCVTASLIVGMLLCTVLIVIAAGVRMFMRGSAAPVSAMQPLAAS